MRKSEKFLINIMAHNITPKCSLEAEDCEVLLELLERHFIRGVFYKKYFKKIAQLIPNNYKSKFAESYYKKWAESQVLFNELIVLKELFSEHKIDFVLLKGFSFSQIIYNDPFVRETSDLDILIARSDLNKASKIIEDLGYLCYYKNTKYEKKPLPLGLNVLHYGFHECEYRKQHQRIKIEIHVDCGSINSEYTEVFLENCVLTKINGHYFNLFDEYHMFLHLIANIYENFETCHGAYFNSYIRDLYDLIKITEHLEDDKIDKIMQLTEAYKLKYKLRHVIRLAYWFNGDDQYLNKFKIDDMMSNEDGFVKWDMTFEERIFNDEKRRIEFSKNYIKKCFNPKNEARIEKIAEDENKYSCFTTNVDSKKIFYNFTRNKSEILFRIKLLDNGRFPLSEQYILALRIMTSGETAYKNNGNPMLQYLIERGKGCIFTSTSCEYQCLMEDKNVIFSIPVKDIFLYNGCFGYDLMVGKKVFNDCYRWCGGKYSNYNPNGQVGLVRLNNTNKGEKQ